jgi:hypothetical protein
MDKEEELVGATSLVKLLKRASHSRCCAAQAIHGVHGQKEKHTTSLLDKR